MSIEALSTMTAAPARLEGIGGAAGTGTGNPAHGDSFAQLLAQAPGAGPPSVTVTPTPAQAPGGSAPAGLGEEVIAGLRRFGQTVGKMEDIGTVKPHGVRSGGAPAAEAPQPSLLRGPAELDPKSARRVPSSADYISQAMDMAQESIGQQAQLYKVMMDFTLVQSSAESLNKSLKTLLTQGGG